jgi:hypothetical protein
MRLLKTRNLSPIFIIPIVYCLINTHLALGANFDLQTLKSTYQPGDFILITADLYNAHDHKVDIVLECLLTGKSGKYPALQIPKLVQLEPKESQTVTLFDMEVTDDFPSDVYKVVVNQLSGGITEDEAQLQFQVQGTLKAIDFSIRVCDDMICTHESLVFVKNREIYLTYNTSTDGLLVEGEIYEDGMLVKSIALPGLVSMDRIGSYTVKATASKADHKTETRETSFAIIESEENIARHIEIDIKPGSYPNAVNLSSKGVLPVAIFSAIDFDATGLPTKNMLFAGAEITIAHQEDVNLDGLLDLVVQVKIQEIDPDQVQNGYAYLIGQMTDGELFQGKDEVTFVPKNQ